MHKGLIKYDWDIPREIIQTNFLQQEILSTYEVIISRFKSLDEEFKFSAQFDETYIYDQLENLFEKKIDQFSFMPFGIKDIFNSKVLPTEMGSPIWKNFNAGNNARLVDEINFRGGVSFCKTTTAEFAVHYFEESSTKNPYNAEHITGTSSSGSAVAVATGALPICTATQTAASIIRPSSFCGVYGFKPSFGALDRTGVLKTNDTLDTLGFIAKDLNLITKAFLNLHQQSSDYPMAKLYKSKFIESKENKYLSLIHI